MDFVRERSQTTISTNSFLPATNAKKTLLARTARVAAIGAPPDEDGRQGRLYISERFKRVIWQAGSERAGDVKLILIQMTRIIRLMAQMKIPLEVISKVGIDQISNLFIIDKV